MIGGLHGAGAVVLIEVGTIMKTAVMKSVRCAVNCYIFVIARYFFLHRFVQSRQVSTLFSGTI